jgi:hypothetical protein
MKNKLDFYYGYMGQVLVWQAGLAILQKFYKDAKIMGHV